MTAPDSKLVDRVARALCEAGGGKPDALQRITEITADMLPPDGFDSGGKGGHFYWRKWTKSAQAALVACHAAELRAALQQIAAPLAPSPDDDDSTPTYTKVIDDYTRGVAIARAALAKLGD